MPERRERRSRDETAKPEPCVRMVGLLAGARCGGQLGAGPDLCATAARTAPTRAVTFGGLRSTFGQVDFFAGRMDAVTLYDRTSVTGVVTQFGAFRVTPSKAGRGGGPMS
jgi:hypothetical protein